MSEHDEPTFDSAAISATISEQITAIHVETYATPITHVTTHVLDDLVVAVLDIELSTIEQRMVTSGGGELVHQLRHAVQHEEEASFRAVVERATGRRVVGFASHTHLDPPWVAEVFRLGPPSSDRPVEP